VRKDQHDALGAMIRQLFTAADSDDARRRLDDAVKQLHRRLPKVAALLDDAEDDVLAEAWPTPPERHAPAASCFVDGREMQSLPGRPATHWWKPGRSHGSINGR
jgi:Transposase, Mutator family